MSNLPEPVPPQELRASDADRERVAEVLRVAAGEGRIGLDELDERLGAVYAARTYADLEPITRDLPTKGSVPVPAGPVASAGTGGTPTSTGAVAVMSGFRRTGPWIAPRVFRCLAFWGGGEIDLREAHYAAGETKIWAFAIMGGIEIIVPEEAEVHVNGVGVMGGFDHDATGVGVPGAPRIIVSGLAFWGGVGVVRRPPEEEVKRRKLERKLERRRARQERKQLRG
jgi:hypothetical protein